jgi:S-adenosylmethionine:tRNA-ribosyltransferase-isomerase (queuine synthetase)
MHFSKHLLKRLEIKGIDLAELTLHVGWEHLTLLRLKICPNTKWIQKN